MSELCKQFCPAYLNCQAEQKFVQKLENSYDAQQAELAAASLDFATAEATLELDIADGIRDRDEVEAIKENFYNLTGFPRPDKVDHLLSRLGSKLASLRFLRAEVTESAEQIEDEFDNCKGPRISLFYESTFGARFFSRLMKESAVVTFQPYKVLCGSKKAAQIADNMPRVSIDFSQG